MNRRVFLRLLTLASTCLGFIPFLPGKLRAVLFQGVSEKVLPQAVSPRVVPAGKSRVVLVRNSLSPARGSTSDSALLNRMLTGAMLKLTAESTPDRAWSKLFSPADVVGIKVNSLGGRRIATHPAVVSAIVEGLKGAGVPENNIIVWDRLTDELRKAGYSINRSEKGVRCYGTDTRYDPDPEISGSIGSCFSSIVSTHCTALISAPVLKDHDLAGVSLSLKNFYGAIHNPNKYHGNNCDPYVADLNTHPYIKDKLRLVVCDALTLLYQGGPAYKPQYALDYQGLLLSRDPVALDRIGWILVDEERLKKGLPSLKDSGREPAYIAAAARRGLGTGDPHNIEFVELLSERSV